MLAKTLILSFVYAYFSLNIYFEFYNVGYLHYAESH